MEYWRLEDTDEWRAMYGWHRTTRSTRDTLPWNWVWMSQINRTHRQNEKAGKGKRRYQLSKTAHINAKEHVLYEVMVLILTVGMPSFDRSVSSMSTELGKALRDSGLN